MPADYVLPEVLNTQGAGALLAAIRARRGTDLNIDAACVRHLGAQAAQVLVAAQQSWAEDGKAFRLIGPSNDMLRGIELLGAGEALKQALT